MSEMTLLGSVPSIVCWTFCVGSKSHCSHLIVPFYNHGVAHLSLGTGMFGELKLQRALLAFSILAQGRQSRWATLKSPCVPLVIRPTHSAELRGVAFSSAPHYQIHGAVIVSAS